jgi:hypothetical protein
MNLRLEVSQAQPLATVYHGITDIEGRSHPRTS